MSVCMFFHLSKMPEGCTLFDVLPSSHIWVLSVSPWCTGNSCQTAGQRHLPKQAGPVCYVTCLDYPENLTDRAPLVAADYRATGSAFGIRTKVLAAGRCFCPQRQSLSALVVGFLLKFYSYFPHSRIYKRDLTIPPQNHLGHPIHVPGLHSHLDSSPYFVSAVHLKHCLPSPCVPRSTGSFPEFHLSRPVLA